MGVLPVWWYGLAAGALVTAVASAKVPSAKAPPAKVPSAKVPSAKVPPRKVPPAKVPPRKVPPAKVPPRKVPPAKVPSPNYNWPKFTDQYDCVVALSAGGAHICTGVLVSFNSVLTAANPLRRHLPQARWPAMRVHLVAGAFNRTLAAPVFSVTAQMRSAPMAATAVGFDGRHNTLHDVMAVATPAKYYTRRCGERVYPRTPCFPDFKGHRERGFPPLADSNWSLATFGFEQRSPLVLMVYRFPGAVRVDCDEWVPREWGHFICLLNTQLLLAGEGTGLFHRDALVGLGAFELSRGRRSVLVFTDLRPYSRLGFHHQPRQSAPDMFAPRPAPG